MPSQLIGLLKQLAWSDFPTKQGQPPAPGKTMTAAFTSASVAPFSFAVDPVAGTKPQQFQLRDALTINIVFDASASFVMSWVANLSQAEQDRLLNHEQGHYKITALVARDFFVDVMQLKGRTFTKSQAVSDEINKLKSTSLGKLKALNTLYDKDTQNSNNASGQSDWDGFFKTALTTARSGGGQSPTGVPFRVRLIDTIKAAGKNIP